MDRYKEKDLVDDLIQRKTEQKMYQADENFPTNEVDPACFLILVINEIISPKNMEQQIHPCPTVLPGSACLLGLGHLPRRGCQTPYRVRWRYIEGCWSWQDRWELGVGTPEPLIWSHPCLNWWSFLFTLKHMLLRGAIPMCHDGSSSSAAMPAAKPKSRPKVKPVPKAKTAQQEATKADVLLSIPQPCSAKHKSLIANQTCQVMKDASTAILECKSWKSKLEAANTQGPQHYYTTVHVFSSVGYFWLWWFPIFYQPSSWGLRTCCRPWWLIAMPTWVTWKRTAWAWKLTLQRGNLRRIFVWKRRSYQKTCLTTELLQGIARSIAKSQVCPRPRLQQKSRLSWAGARAN